MLSEPPTTVRTVPHSHTRKRRRPWREKFREAIRGVKLGIRGHSSFSVHFFCAALAIATCVALDCRLVEWCLILMCVGGVFVAELFNSAIETLFHGLEPETKSRWNACMEIAAGAVLVASMFAVLIGLLIFGNRLGELMGWWK
jgi:diacylglycerol kinase